MRAPLLPTAAHRVLVARYGVDALVPAVMDELVPASVAARISLLPERLQELAMNYILDHDMPEMTAVVYVDELRKEFRS